MISKTEYERVTEPLKCGYARPSETHSKGRGHPWGSTLVDVGVGLIDSTFLAHASHQGQPCHVHGIGDGTRELFPH